MDSDETLTSQSQFSSSVQLLEDVSLEDIMNCEGGYDHSSSQNAQHPQKYLSSRLSSCSSFSNGQGVDQGSSSNPYCFDHGGYTSMCSLQSMSRLSIESFDGGADADEELSDENKDKGKFSMGFSSESDDGEVICYSLPKTPPRKRAVVPNTQRRLMVAKKDYASETDAQKSVPDGGQKINRYHKRTKSRSKSSRRNCSTGVPGGRSKVVLNGEEDNGDYNSNNNRVGHVSLSANNSSSYCVSGGESEGCGLMVITKPKGGSRSICMDMEEVKACRELGFELEHERMLETHSRLSINVSNLDTSSGGNSPISSWRISSPGDNPREVKARIKVWAQAVAIASSTSKPSIN
uniref:Uncharacterized protein n=1 Tax=Kalanchoe fedtschenkoi TaxID=63787 RepID=A0A7N0UVG7_KALFE